MIVFHLIALLGGLAMFLYGMRTMGDGLRESASGKLKSLLGRLTDTPGRSFLLGLFMTAVIQSSKATIVITSGLVGAGILSLHQSLAVIIGANVGTTVTGQIIRLLELDPSGASFLQFFKPSTLASFALLTGVILLMSRKNEQTGNAGQIIVGLGILFTGLLHMTDAVSALAGTGLIDQLFAGLEKNLLLAYLIGAGVAFVLQSASATIGVLQAFSVSGLFTFSTVYAALVGVYLGDCVTTAMVCSINADPDARRVGIVNILYNLCKTAAILAGVTLLRRLGFLDGIWDVPIFSGGIANVNTLFNLISALLFFPLLNLYEKLSYRLL